MSIELEDLNIMETEILSKIEDKISFIEEVLGVIHNHNEKGEGTRLFSYEKDVERFCEKDKFLFEIQFSVDWKANKLDMSQMRDILDKSIEDLKYFHSSSLFSYYESGVYRHYQYTISIN